MTNKQMESLKKDIRERPTVWIMFFTGVLCTVAMWFVDTRHFEELSDMFYALVLIIGAFGCFIMCYQFMIYKKLSDVLEELQHEKAAEEQPDDD